MALNKRCLDTLSTAGLAALPGWAHWGDQQLLTSWQHAEEELPKAVQQLEGVSKQGPPLLVCFDLETTGLSE